MDILAHFAGHFNPTHYLTLTIKRFEDTLSPREILQGIKLDSTADDEIVISWDAGIAQQKGFKRWKKGIVDTKKWMCVRVADEDDHVRITFY